MAAALAARTGRAFVGISDPSEFTQDRLAAIDPQFVFLPHWSHRIAPAVFQRFECVVFHMTDLPFGRGGSPLQNLIARGIHETRITALRCVQELDAGPVYLKKPLSLHGSAEEIFLRAGAVIEDMIVELLHRPVAPVAQVGEATVFQRRRREDGDLRAATTLDQAFDLVRMLDAEGYPPAFVEVGPFTIEFSRASLKTGTLVADARISMTTKPNDTDEK
jgi:methionyl-tRNA formyltransferase